MKYLILLLIALCFPLKASSQFVMPIGGEQNKDWFIWTYMDHDTATGSVRNFHCSDYLYDNWSGLIFVLKNLQVMDQGIPVFASGAGRVVTVYDKSADRQKISLGSDHGNYIRIRHDSNLYSFYGYLKKGSVQWKVGDSVNKGDIIASVGASGGGYYSKLYFRFEDSLGGKFHDPMGDQCNGIPTLLSSTPVYDTTFALIDTGLAKGIQYSNDTLMERPPTLTEVSISDPSEDTICAWVQFKNLSITDSLGTVWTDPHGIVFHNGENSPSTSNDHFGYFHRYYPTALLAGTGTIPDTGLWTIEWRYNHHTLSQQAFRLVAQHSGVAQANPTTQTITFPQPSKYHVTIVGICAKEAHLFDIEGIEHAIEFDDNSDGTSISWQDLPKGVYYINLKDQSGNSHRVKIMVSP